MTDRSHCQVVEVCPPGTSPAMLNTEDLIRLRSIPFLPSVIGHTIWPTKPTIQPAGMLSVTSDGAATLP
ncbi:hypothetical protein [Aquicoccus sp. SU-CL01552]|uniref:hypothetical protein n=1 Tax=Aquicoccus sp. SU-CL01552 TaxID=3127656 RepID=UPI00333F54A4